MNVNLDRRDIPKVEIRGCGLIRKILRPVLALGIVWQLIYPVSLSAQEYSNNVFLPIVAKNLTIDTTLPLPDSPLVENCKNALKSIAWSFSSVDCNSLVVTESLEDGKKVTFLSGIAQTPENLDTGGDKISFIVKSYFSDQGQKNRILFEITNNIDRSNGSYKVTLDWTKDVPVILDNIATRNQTEKGIVDDSERNISTIWILQKLVSLSSSGFHKVIRDNAHFDVEHIILDVNNIGNTVITATPGDLGVISVNDYASDRTLLGGISRTDSTDMPGFIRLDSAEIHFAGLWYIANLGVSNLSVTVVHEILHGLFDDYSGPWAENVASAMETVLYTQYYMAISPVYYPSTEAGIDSFAIPMTEGKASIHSFLSDNHQDSLRSIFADKYCPAVGFWILRDWDGGMSKIDISYLDLQIFWAFAINHFAQDGMILDHNFKMWATGSLGIDPLKIYSQKEFDMIYSSYQNAKIAGDPSIEFFSMKGVIGRFEGELDSIFSNFNWKLEYMYDQGSQGYVLLPNSESLSSAIVGSGVKDTLKGTYWEAFIRGFIRKIPVLQSDGFFNSNTAFPFGSDLIEGNFFVALQFKAGAENDIALNIDPIRNDILTNITHQTGSYSAIASAQWSKFNEATPVCDTDCEKEQRDYLIDMLVLNGADRSIFNIDGVDVGMDTIRQMYMSYLKSVDNNRRDWILANLSVSLSFEVLKLNSNGIVSSQTLTLDSQNASSNTATYSELIGSGNTLALLKSVTSIINNGIDTLPIENTFNFEYTAYYRNGTKKVFVIPQARAYILEGLPAVEDRIWYFYDPRKLFVK
jgi:hypothetical protein